MVDDWVCTLIILVCVLVGFLVAIYYAHSVCLGLVGAWFGGFAA